MKPIAICRHEASQGPGYLQTFLDRHEVPYRIFAIDQGDTPPNRASEFSGVAILGSNASANDSFSWIRREDALLQDALLRERPILGHCFGGQMLARALGAKVRRNSVPQIGWGKVLVTLFPEARDWMGLKRELNVFHWHFDTFEIPRGAKRVLFGTYCMNKAFCYGPHIGFQSHLEVTAASITAWCTEGREQLLQHQHFASVQSEAQILHDIDTRVSQLHELADFSYWQWLRKCSDRALPIQPITTSHRPHGGHGWGELLRVTR